MSSSVFPTLSGLGFDVHRVATWSNQRQQSVSGKITSLAYWSFPKWSYELVFNYLRADPTNLEFQALAAFFNLMKGGFDTFLYLDPDDCAVTSQLVGTGDGVTTGFQLVRTMTGASGSFVEPILAPKQIDNLYLDGLNTPSGWSFNQWGVTNPGFINFDTAPGAGVAISVDMGYYFPCRFDDDTMDFTKFLYQMWKADSVKFTTEK